MIYFLRQLSTGYIKIGQTGNIKGRIAAAERKVGSVELIGGIEWSFYEEENLHLRFKQFNVRYLLEDGYERYGKEWFYPDPSLLDYIKRYTDIVFIESVIARLVARPYKTRQYRVNLISHTSVVPGLY